MSTGLNIMSTGNMNLTLKVWRQKNNKTKGALVDYKLSDISPDMSFLEMFDVLNEQLINKSEEPIVFDHDCREGICGSCVVRMDQKTW
jgi:succinate dehydrogenase / fumarate reductase, iron-sulfur subunit